LKVDAGSSNPPSTINPQNSTVYPPLSTVKKILVSVSIGWYDPAIYIATDGTLGGLPANTTSTTGLALQGEALQVQIASASAQVNYILENDLLFKDLKDKVSSLQSKLDLLSLQFEQQASISGLLGVASNATAAWSVDQSSGKVNVNFFGSITLATGGTLNLNGNDIINVSKIIGMNGKWKIDESGNLVAETITAKKLCLEEVCITKEELKTLLQSAGIVNYNVSSADNTNEILQIEISNATTTSTTTELVATTTPSQ
jgi:hypothetical protein